MKLAPFKLERYFARYEFTAPHLLCSSDCESLALDELLDLEPGAREELTALRLGYVEGDGMPAVRASVAGLFDGITSDEVLLHAGSSEAIFAFMTSALEASDHVIVHAPCYQSHYEVARSIGCEITSWTGDERRAWELDVEFLKRALRKNTKAVMITAPHNPTGYLMTRSALDEVVDVLRRHDVMLFSDEVFRFIEQDPADRLPSAADVYERAVAVGGLSKTFGLPGVRVGWAATHDARMLSSMARTKDYLSLCNRAVDEFLAGIALRNRRKLHRRTLDLLLANLRVLDGFLARRHDMFEWQRPRAGSIGLVRYHGAEGAARFCDDVVRACGVLLLPSVELEFGDAHFRVGFGRRDMPESVSRLEAYLDSAEAPRFARI
ncbi:MAG TPA: aminotransferase class I/II-fold pyridoxal phosphate-dependent enzyme [Candidatus Eremiobacteraceae bacterium]|nr:aminotransferase class I/II-fold pyridoxal phosphate-dependent enzyme [Candidatus Eremiobacteraceae bacterium]